MQAAVNDENVACVASRLLRYLHKSGALGITVDLDFQKQMFTNCGRKARRMEKRQSQLHGLYYPDCEDIVLNQNDYEYLEPIRNVIFDENPEKFREIRLFNAPMGWFIDARTVFCAKFSLLEAIYFSWMYHYPQTEDAVHNFQFDFGALLNLKEVFIFGFPSKCIPAPHFIVSDTITVLHLSEIDYNTCVTVLLNLQRLRIISMMRPVTRNYHEDYIIQPNPIAGLTIQLPNLETFEWTFPDADSVWNYEVLKILPILYIPSIHTITLHQPWNPGFKYVSGLGKFLNRLPSSCYSMTLVTNYFHSNHAIHFTIGRTLLVIPTTVSQIELRSSCLGFANSVGDYTSLLSDPLRGLSRITKVSVVKDSRCWGNPYGANCMQQQVGYLQASDRCAYPVFDSSNFLKAMKKRVHFGLGESRFEIEYQTSLTGLVEWKEEDKGGLRRLVEQSGLEVEVVEDGKRVEWL